MTWAESAAIQAIKSAVTGLEEGWEDATVLPHYPGDRIVLSSDQINARHSYPGEDLRTLVRRGTAEALSDLASVGADAYGVQIDVRAPDHFTLNDFTAIGTGLDDQLRREKIILLQGSNLSRGEFGVSTTVVGICRRPPLHRAGAREGDAVLISGPLGGWNGALAMLNAGVADTLDEIAWSALTSEFLDYRAELAFGRVLADSGVVTACIDCNDSLLKSALDLGRASRLQLTINPALLPLGASAVRAASILGTDAHDFALRGTAGDDRLLFTCEPGEVPLLSQQLENTVGRTPTVIGVVTAGTDVSFQRAAGPTNDSGLGQTIYQATFSAGRRALGLPGLPPLGSTVHSASSHPMV